VCVHSCHAHAFQLAERSEELRGGCDGSVHVGASAGNAVPVEAVLLIAVPQRPAVAIERVVAVGESWAVRADLIGDQSVTRSDENVNLQSRHKAPTALSLLWRLITFLTPLRECITRLIRDHIHDADELSIEREWSVRTAVTIALTVSDHVVPLSRLPNG
jgi:hypothetical protein